MGENFKLNNTVLCEEMIATRHCGKQNRQINAVCWGVLSKECTYIIHYR
jgi:hypothetical protein